MKEHNPEKIDESSAPEGGEFHPVDTTEVLPGGLVVSGSGAEGVHNKEEIADLVANIKHEVGGKNFSGSEGYELSGKYEVNGISINTNELSGLVDTLSPEDYTRAKEMVEDALFVNGIAHDKSLPEKVRHEASAVTTANGFFSAGESAEEVDPEQRDQMNEARKIVAESKGISGFSEWVSRKGKSVLAPLLTVIGLGAISTTASAGNNSYPDRAAAVGVRVLGDVLGTKAETPFRVAKDMGNVQERAERAAQNADIQRVEQVRQLSIREKDQLNRVVERVEAAKMKFATELRIYKLKNTDATEKDFIATKTGETLYRQVLQAEDRATLDVKKIKNDSEAARARADERYMTQQDRINAQAGSDAKRVYRNAEGRELDAMGRGAKDVSSTVVHGIFQR